MKEVKKTKKDSALITDPMHGTQAAITRPENIRSIFAQFRDPDSSDLLAANKGKTQAGINAGLLAEKHADDLPAGLKDPDLFKQSYDEINAKAIEKNLADDWEDDDPIGWMDEEYDDPFDWDEINYPGVAPPHEPAHGMNKAAVEEDIPTPWPAPKENWSPAAEGEIAYKLQGASTGKQAEMMHADSPRSAQLIKKLWEKDPERMQRAKDMGFDTDRVFFHGTPHDDITKFEPQRHGEAYDEPGLRYDASFFASNPNTAESYQYHGTPMSYPKGKDAYDTAYKELNDIQKAAGKAYEDSSNAEKNGDTELANKYMNDYQMLNVDAHNKWKEVEELHVAKDPQPNILPVLLRRGDTRFTNWEGGTPGSRKISDDIKAALSEGRDSAVMKNIFDTPFHHQAAIFDAKRIRSIFAQFRDKDSDDLLAANPGSLPSLLAEALLARKKDAK
jgi:hypothetical protein